MEQFNITEDYLVTYREFMSALRSGLKNTLYKTLLPRTLSFADVLDSRAEEKTYEVSDSNLDDFYMFRYELNSVFQSHLFRQEKNKDLYLLGQYPLSKCQGLPVKDMVDHLRKNAESFKNRKDELSSLENQCQEIYQPPGVIKSIPTIFDQQSKIDKDVRMTIPSDFLAKRKKMPEFTSARKETSSKAPTGVPSADAKK